MRILLTADPEYPIPPKYYGGIERIVDGIAGELRARGHSVALLAHPDSTCDVDERFAWRHGGGSLEHVRALCGAVRLFRPAVVHSFSRLAYLFPLLPARLGKVMSYQRHTGGRRLQVAAMLGGRRFRFTGCSEYIAAMGRRNGGTWSAIPNFVDTGFYRFAPQVAADAPLVFLSRVERIKGAHTAIEIARRSGRRLIIAGNRVDGPDGTAYWQREIEPHLEPGRVEYVGPVDDAQKNDLLGRAAAMLVPIEWDEPFGIVFAEALACGTPVISCPRGALPEIVLEGQHGHLVRSVAEGVAAVGSLSRLSRLDCRQRAERLFSRRVVVDQYEKLYREITEIITA